MENIENLYENACSQLTSGKIEQALENFITIIDKSPSHSPSLNKIGVIYAQNGEISKAKEYFEMALAADEGYVPALVNMGNICKESAKIDTAEAYYLDAIDRDNEYSLAYYNLAVLYKGKGEYELYIKNYKKYKKLYKKKLDTGLEKEYSGNMILRKMKNMTVLIVLGLCVLIFFIIKNK
jgi:tetratricopeptide (TPR) repeat protein